MSRAVVRTEKCGPREARARLAQARKFLEVAHLVSHEDQDESSSVAAALAVFAGIAAADAACCAVLGRRSRSQDHRGAEGLVKEIEPGGSIAATALGRLLDLKDTATYGTIFVSRQKLTGALRQADSVLAFAMSAIR